MEKAAALIGRLLEREPSLRDDDRELYLAYLKEYRGAAQTLGEGAWTALCAFWRDKDTLSYEAVRRARQKLQQAGLYQGARHEERGRIQHEVRGALRE